MQDNIADLRHLKHSSSLNLEKRGLAMKWANKHQHYPLREWFIITSDKHEKQMVISESEMLLCRKNIYDSECQQQFLWLPKDLPT